MKLHYKLARGSVKKKWGVAVLGTGAFVLCEYFYVEGATRARLPPGRTRANPQPGHRILASGNRAGRCRWSAGLLGDLPFPPPLHFALYSPRFTLISSQYLAVKSRPNLFTHVYVDAFLPGTASLDHMGYHWIAFEMLFPTSDYSPPTKAEPASILYGVTQISACGKRGGHFCRPGRITAAVRREHCTSVHTLALRGDGVLDAPGSVVLTAPAPLGLKRGKKLYGIFRRSLSVSKTPRVYTQHTHTHARAHIRHTPTCGEILASRVSLFQEVKARRGGRSGSVGGVEGVGCVCTYLEHSNPTPGDAKAMVCAHACVWQEDVEHEYGRRGSQNEKKKIVSSSQTASERKVRTLWITIFTGGLDANVLASRHMGSIHSDVTADICTRETRQRLPPSGGFPREYHRLARARIPSLPPHSTSHCRCVAHLDMHVCGISVGRHARTDKPVSLRLTSPSETSGWNLSGPWLAGHSRLDRATSCGYNSSHPVWHDLYECLQDIHGDSSPFLLQPFQALSNGLWPRLTSPHPAIQFVPKMFYRVEFGALGGPLQSANIVVGVPLHSIP
ncbi:hypothetical protein PR048_027538 [Dryococelus australis]|uniref:Uncharacterized protein n=1 Tax=Dryococelus australis TaxID=614101 RepID=A0ABQ9GGS8_9NEOP|nr:hypothetical protein PR048_027538 [Dryococelus australis]